MTNPGDNTEESSGSKAKSTPTTVQSTSQLNKDPPSLKNAKSYDDWLKLLKIWRLYTTIPAKRQGPSLILILHDEAQEAALELSETEISSETGIDNIIVKLDNLYKKDTTLQKYNTLEEFETYKRKENTNIQQYIIEFEKRLNKTKSHGTTWSDDLLAYRLLKNANLTESHQQLAKATISQLTYTDMKEKLKSIFNESSHIPSGENKFSVQNINYTQDLDNLQNLDISGQEQATHEEYYDDEFEDFEYANSDSPQEPQMDQHDTFYNKNRPFRRVGY